MSNFANMKSHSINGSIDDGYPSEGLNDSILRKSKTMDSPERKGSLHEARRAAEDYYQMFESRGLSFFSNLF